MLTKGQITIYLVAILGTAYISLNEYTSIKESNLLWLATISLQLIFRLYNLKTGRAKIKWKQRNLIIYH